MDDETTLIVFGDHGMTEDGNHGGGTELELRTVFFAYQKEPFPFSHLYALYKHHFSRVDYLMKLSDIAAIVSNILNLPIPFSNLGVLHPALVQTNNVYQLKTLYEQNLNQVYDYLN